MQYGGVCVSGLIVWEDPNLCSEHWKLEESLRALCEEHADNHPKVKKAIEAVRLHVGGCPYCQAGLSRLSNMSSCKEPT